MQLEDLKAHLRRLAAQSTQAAIHNPYAAEMGSPVARWYVLATMPGQERIAAGHLVARRFGIYLPEIEATIVSRGREQQRRRLLIPGYIFVFVWGIERNARRMLACTGVHRLLYEAGRPAVIADSVIDELAAHEWSSMLCGPAYKPPRRGKRGGQLIDPVMVSTKSYAMTA